MCINVDEYITNDLLVPLEISSCLVSKRTSSRQHNCCVPPYEEPANACNQIFGETKSSSSNCHCDAPASTHNDHHQRSPSLPVEYEIDRSLSPVQIRHCRIEELEGYAYAVIETVNHESGFSYTTNGAHTMTTTDEPHNYLRAAPNQILPAKCRNCFIKIPPLPMVDLTLTRGTRMTSTSNAVMVPRKRRPWRPIPTTEEAANCPLPWWRHYLMIVEVEQSGRLG